jgi:hypothetical protein
MSRALLASAAILAVGFACRGQRPAFDIVKVPETAYLTPDAAVAPDAGAPDANRREGGTFRPRIPQLCFAPPSVPPQEEDAADDHPECARYHPVSQIFDGERTTRVREKVGKPVCCYQVSREEE